MQKVELLAPAGNLYKLKIALKYGADAVRLGRFLKIHKTLEGLLHLQAALSLLRQAAWESRNGSH